MQTRSVRPFCHHMVMEVGSTIRPQQKQRKELAAKQSALKKGDKVVTIGGMHAIVNAVSERTVSLKISEGNFVKYDKTAIASVVPSKSGGEEKEEE